MNTYQDLNPVELPSKRPTVYSDSPSVLGIGVFVLFAVLLVSVILGA